MKVYVLRHLLQQVPQDYEVMVYTGADYLNELEPAVRIDDDDETRAVTITTR